MVLMRSIFHALKAAATLQPAPDFQFPTDWAEREWDLFERGAHHHRVAALLAHHAQTGRLPALPEPWQSRFQKALHATRLRHRAALQDLEAIEAAFNRSGIPYVTLKGPHLSAEAYSIVGIRSFDDLDILVEKNRISAAQDTLMELGYQRLPKSAPAWLMRRYHFHTQWLHPDTRQCVELHWRPADVRRLPTRPHAPDHLRDLRDDPAMMAVYLAVHISKHALFHAAMLTDQMDPLVFLHPWSGIRWIWVLDFQGLCAARDLDPAQLAEAARRWRVENALTLTQYLAAPPFAKGPAARRAHLAYAAHAALLRRMERDLNQSHMPATMPWWLRSHPWTGFRPARLLELVAPKE